VRRIVHVSVDRCSDDTTVRTIVRPIGRIPLDSEERSVVRLKRFNTRPAFLRARNRAQARSEAQAAVSREEPSKRVNDSLARPMGYMRLSLYRGFIKFIC